MRCRPMTYTRSVSRPSLSRTPARPPSHNPYEKPPASPLLLMSCTRLMARLLPFPTRRVRESATYTLRLSTRWQRLSKAKPWLHPRAPEHLGNLLQQLTRKRPAVVFIIERLVVEILAQLEP